MVSRWSCRWVLCGAWTHSKLALGVVDVVLGVLLLIRETLAGTRGVLHLRARLGFGRR